MSNIKELLRKQFEVLVYLQKTKEMVTWETLKAEIDISSEQLEYIVEELRKNGFLSSWNKEYQITEKGVEVLEPYRAKRAIFIAAGFGSRLVPITINTPKPLVRVNGIRMIDTLINAVLAAGIEEIYIVRGYLGEQFDQLLYKYPMIRFIDNPMYQEANNISSIVCAKHLLQNAYVFEADLVLYNPSLITKYQYTSNYLGVFVESTEDWCFETEKGVITRLGIGGKNCYHEYGISYWNAKDGSSLMEDVPRVFETLDGKNLYWDQVPLERCASHYKVEVRPCTFEDIIEIDSFEDLKKIDDAYQ